MANANLVRGVWSALGALREVVKDTILGASLDYISNLLLLVTRNLDEANSYHVETVAMVSKRYETEIRAYVANTASEYDDKIVDEFFEAIDALLAG